LYGETRAANFGPLALKAMCQKFVGAGWCRSLINQRVGRIVPVFKWAVGEEAVKRAALKAGLTHWHPNQLRHTFATQVRKQHGLEAAQVLLGHARADVTQVYAERDGALAATVAAKIQVMIGASVAAWSGYSTPRPRFTGRGISRLTPSPSS